MIREQINQLIEEITRSYPQEDIFEARKVYQKMSGEVFEDDKSYESRVGCFLEWYTFDRPFPETSTTPLLGFLEEPDDSLSPEKQELVEALTQNIHGLFMAKKIKTDSVTLLEVFDDIKYQVHETQGAMLFNTEDVFEARLIPYRGQYYFTEHFCYHPKPTVKFILAKVKALKGTEAVDLKREKQLEKELVPPQKVLKKITAKIQKLKSKLEGATKENKIAALKEEIAGLENQSLDLENQILSLNEQLNQLRTVTIQGEHRRNRFNLMRKLSYMSLKWERSRQIDIQDIYQD